LFLEYPQFRATNTEHFWARKFPIKLSWFCFECGQRINCKYKNKCKNNFFGIF